RGGPAGGREAARLREGDGDPMNARPFDRDAFLEPSRDYGILPFWFLNGELDPDEMRFQLGELRDKGMQGVVLHGRFGLEMPYVGDTYLDRIALAVDEASRLGLATWIYDEMNWPSGTADKAVVPWTKNMFRRFVERNGYDLRGRLPDLFFDATPDAAQTRHDFYSSLTAFYTDAYYRQLRDWCREHGVVFTAHLLYEEWL